MGVTSKKYTYKNYPKLYSVWGNMKTRCSNPKAAGYENYGGRGIGYSPDWEKFTGFCIDMASSFKEDLSLERIDNNKNYSKENCKWATRLEQANNTRKNFRVTINGVSKTIPQWARQYGFKQSTVYQRYYVYGWRTEDLFQPLMRKRS